jgi:hemolysin activation/secretion protein
MKFPVFLGRISLPVKCLRPRIRRGGALLIPVSPLSGEGEGAWRYRKPQILKIVPLLVLLTSLQGPHKLGAQTNAPVGTNAPGPRFVVRSYALIGSTVFSTNQLAALGELLTPCTGTNVGFAEIKQALITIQAAYGNLGYATIGVALTPQQLTNGVVKVAVTQGQLIDINIVGNNFFSSNNIRRALPTLDTNRLLNTMWFQPEIDNANANQDRQIYPVIGAGPDPGTSVLTLRVKDRLPLHGHVELNNKGTVDTPPLRIDSTLTYNNLWQWEHQVGVQYAFSPEEYKSKNAPFYEGPLVVNYSGFYRIPLTDSAGAVQSAELTTANFGYNELTHAVQLPPPTGHPELIIYASRSSSESAISYGPTRTVLITTNQDIYARDANQSLTINENIGAKFTYPLPQLAGVQSSVSVGVDFKHFRQKTFNTNISSLIYYDFTDGGERFVDFVTEVNLGSSSAQDLYYVPLSIGWSASRPDQFGQTAFSYNQSIFLSSFSSPDKKVQRLANSTEAGGTFTTINLALSREQPLFADWSLAWRANGQWASAPVINNEQFGIGGSGGVRGYKEGEEYGDSGWRTSLDLRAPAFRDMPAPEGWPRMDWRVSAFVDYGERYLIDPGPRDAAVCMLGSGASLYVTVGEHFDARLTLAFSLLDTPQTKAGQGRAYFTVGAQF